jgi:hypothetical protein
MGAGCAMTCLTVRRFDGSNGNPTFRQVMGTITRYVWHLSQYPSVSRQERW